MAPLVCGKQKETTLFFEVPAPKPPIPFLVQGSVASVSRSAGEAAEALSLAEEAQAGALSFSSEELWLGEVRIVRRRR